MPVIRGRSTARALTPEQRLRLKDRLVGEFSARGTLDGPLIFEIPREESDQFDVIIIWNEFEGVSLEDRDQVILDAYHELGRRPSMEMGVTEREADNQNLLPYDVSSGTEALAGLGEPVSVVPADLAEWHAAMIEEGGIARDDGTVLLRFPTRAMAEDAQARLAERFPRARWSISTRLDSIP